MLETYRRENMKAVYPGSFDPVTSGHIDVIERSARIFDEVVVAVGVNIEKQPFFTVEERLEFLKNACRHLKNVQVDYFSGLTVDYVKISGAGVIIRSLRAVSDFEAEFQMALMNKNLDPEVETLFMMTNPEHLFLSSSLIKQVAEMGASLEGFVSKEVEIKILEKIKQRGQEAAKR